MIVPIERSETIPSRLYTEPRYHDFDKQHLFPETWQYVGHVSRVQNHGDYLAGTVADNPVIIVRGKDNLLRAFFNVCRHRGGPLAIDDHGSCNALQCKYHGWTYLLDGSLRGVPQFDRVELFDRKDYGLIPVQLEIWDGLIFVNLSKRKANSPTLQSVVNGISERIAPRRLADTKFFRRINYEVRCNWKVYVDNYLEGYHLPYVHPELCTLLDYQNYITEIFEYYSLQHSPLTGTDTLYGKDGGAALYYFIFPNFMLNILPGRLQTNLVVPLSHNTTRVIFDYYYDDITSPHARKMAEEDIKYSDHVQHEDMQICEHVQQGLESMAYDKGRFSVEMERGVYHFQCLLKKAYRAIMDR
ncbi:MAG: Rieske 2Fe-2S domain-containing protein [Ignavibacteria bacterium]|nr:Rieske 2Fe-2S domain-containing protein [Ignavibacteria bacterium]